MERPFDFRLVQEHGVRVKLRRPSCAKDVVVEGGPRLLGDEIRFQSRVTNVRVIYLGKFHVN